jgi:hypothetical protein
VKELYSQKSYRYKVYISTCFKRGGDQGVIWQRWPLDWFACELEGGVNDFGIPRDIQLPELCGIAFFFATAQSNLQSNAVAISQCEPGLVQPHTHFFNATSDSGPGSATILKPSICIRFCAELVSIDWHGLVIDYYTAFHPASPLFLSFLLLSIFPASFNDLIYRYP